MGNENTLTLNTLRPSVVYICVGGQIITGSGNGLSPVRWQAITWTNDDLLSTGPAGIHFWEILIEIQIFALKTRSPRWRPFFIALNLLSFVCEWIFTYVNDVHLTQQSSQHCLQLGRTRYGAHKMIEHVPAFVTTAEGKTRISCEIQIHIENRQSDA